jgi:hypothetical protein
MGLNARILPVLSQRPERAHTLTRAKLDAGEGANESYNAA